jgi:hypothetical protein
MVSFGRIEEKVDVGVEQPTNQALRAKREAPWDSAQTFCRRPRDCGRSNREAC